MDRKKTKVVVPERNAFHAKSNYNNSEENHFCNKNCSNKQNQKKVSNLICLRNNSKIWTCSLRLHRKISFSFILKGTSKCKYNQDATHSFLYVFCLLHCVAFLKGHWYWKMNPGNYFESVMQFMYLYLGFFHLC
jgi:hypothetical protein